MFSVLAEDLTAEDVVAKSNKWLKLRRYTGLRDQEETTVDLPVGKDEKHDILLYVRNVTKSGAKKAVVDAFDMVNKTGGDANALNSNGGKIRTNAEGLELLKDFDATIQALKDTETVNVSTQTKNREQLLALMDDPIAGTIGNDAVLPLFKNAYPKWAMVRYRLMYQLHIECGYWLLPTHAQHKRMKNVNYVVHGADLVEDTLTLRCSNLYDKQFKGTGVLENIFEVAYWLKPAEAEGLCKSRRPLCFLPRLDSH
jgi:hypothetical protein